MIALDIKTHWPDIRQHFKRSFSTNFHVAIASIDSQGLPVNTPIGSLFLYRDCRGIYYEKYPSTLPGNVAAHPEICVLAVNSGVWFWLRSLLQNRFYAYPGIRLHGILGISRKPSELEKKRLKRRMRATRFLPGNKSLWGDMDSVREIQFTRAESVQLGSMSSRLNT